MQTKTKPLLIIAAALLLTALCPFWGLEFIPPLELFNSASPAGEVLYKLRLPRVFAAFLSGAALSLGGVVFQAMFRNPLATPFTLGVSSGAAFGAASWVILGSSVGLLGSLTASLGSMGFALCGAGLSMLIVFGLARGSGSLSTLTLLLAGVVINFFFSSLVLFMQYLSSASDSLRIIHWLMGSLAGVESARLAELLFIVISCSLLLFNLSAELNLLAVGEDIAISRGVSLQKVKLQLFAVASIMVGAVVAIAGPIGFVGMMIPHICRLYLGWRHELLIPAAFFGGGCFLALCDLLSRVLLAPAEMPVGIITALCGGPFFLWTMFRKGRTEQS